MSKFIAWVVLSSKDPRKISLSVKAALVAIIPFFMHAVTVSCGFGLVCLGVDSTHLQEVAEVTSDIIFWVFSIVSAIGFVYGFIRKLWLTAKSENKVLEG